MIRNVYSYILTLVVLTCSASAMAINHWEDDNNFAAYSKGPGKVHLKVPVRCEVDQRGTFPGGDYGPTYLNTYDATANNPFQGDSYLYYVLVDKDGNRGEVKPFAYVASFDWGDKDNAQSFVAVEAGGGWCVVTKEFPGRGHITATNCYLSKEYPEIRYSVGGSDYRFNVNADGFTQHAVKYSQLNNISFECDWEMPALDTTYTVEIGFHQAIYRYWSGKVVQRYATNDHYMGTFSVDQDVAPSLSDAFFCPMNTEGQMQVGKLGVVYSCTQKPVSYTPYDNGVAGASVNTSDYAGMVMIDAADEERTYKMQFVTYFKQSETITQTQTSNTLVIKPYHKIHNFTVEPYVADGVDKGYNRISWQLYHMRQEDVVDGDMFILTRATRPDFSDEETLICTSKIEVQDQDTILCSMIDSTCRTPLDATGKFYYRIQRASAAVWEWAQSATDLGYQAVDSIGAHAMQWSLYPGNDHSAVLFNYDSERGASVQVLMCPAYDADLHPINYRWDSRASLTLTRHNLTTGETQTFNLLKDKRAVFSPCTQSADNPQGGWAYKFLDTDLRPCCTYTYSATLDTVGCVLTTVANAVLEAAAATSFHVEDTPPAIRSCEAGQGESKDFVLLHWDIDVQAVDSFVIERRLKTDLTPASRVRLGVTTEAVYKDYTAAPGVDKLYEYFVIGYYSCDGEVKVLPEVAVASGWLNPYASVEGYVQLPNGTGIPGIRVELKHETTGENDSTVTRYVTTDASGRFFCDSLPYGVNTTYSVKPEHTELTFASTQNHQASIDVSFAPHSAEQSGYFFCPNSSRTITGRVLYHKTSVPVAYAEFEMQLDDATSTAYTLTGQNGTPIRTDLNGYFSLQVPNNIRTLRVRKDRHNFLNDGYLEVVSGSRVMILTEDIAECRFYDTTKARVLGRVVGGTKEGSYPLGYDLSSNNLGDSLTLVLELEGDKVSWLVNDPNDLSLTEIDTVVTHVCPDGSAAAGLHYTKAQTTRKRITIHPDNGSGEWQLDLLPVRYKVVQMTAQGYSTLLSADEAMPVLDLTNFADSTALYNYIYRSQPRLEYNQTFYGLDRDYLGVEVVDMVNLDNTYSRVYSAYKDSVTGATRYLFGYPIYSTGTYQMKVRAFEPYFYNNDSTSSHVQNVPLSGVVHIYNGLNSKVDSLLCTLNDNGVGSFTFTANNTTFSRTGENALRTLDMWIPYRGSQVEAKPIRAYVTGNKELPGAVTQKLGSSISQLAVLRDPYGAGSYSYMSKGTSFQSKFSYTKDIKWGFSLNLTGGVTWTTYTGVSLGTFFATGSEVNVTFPNVKLAINGVNHEAGTCIYNFSTDEEIKTSAAATMSGANADVYIGTVTDIAYSKRLAIQMLDSVSYQLMLPEFTAGTAHLMTSGRDKDGDLFYLAVMETAQFGYTYPAAFAYSQNYIQSTIIPDLKRKRNALIMDMSMPLDSARGQANRFHTNYYVSKVPADAPNLGEDTTYHVIRPSNAIVTNMLVDQVDQYNQLIDQWVNLIKMNEAVKVQAIRGGEVFETYDVAGGASRSYSETASYSQSRTQISNFTVGLDISGGAGRKGTTTQKPTENDTTAIRSQKGMTIKLPGVNFSFSLGAIIPTPVQQDDNQETLTKSRKVGFVIAPAISGATSQTVYRVNNTIWNNAAKDVRNQAFNLHEEDASVSWHSSSDESILASDFVFTQNGGISCCPWEGADSTIYLLPKTALSAPTLKLENPIITLDVHEQSNIPADEAAIFTLTLSNETEVESGKLSNFILYVDDASNPNGVEVYIDGLPVGDGRVFVLQAGETLTKVMEVRRGNGYDFSNIRLGFTSECTSTMPAKKRSTDYEYFSVHFRPVASPVSISAPDDKWVLNTLSSHDADGYYLPVTISDYNINSDGFDHIELQYKLSTEGEQQWVNLCSFYADQSLMAEATGRCQRINSSGKIEGYRFYGERDPIEQHYDLRAVSFSRYGNGYITRASEVISGIKDTRVPTQFGKAKPTDGILTFEDDIVINFSEDIAGQYLDKDNNFQVLGSTNSISLETSTSLSFPGTESTTALSRTDRSLNSTPFTIDMMVKTSANNTDQQLFAIHSEGAKMDQISFSLASVDDTPYGALRATVGNRMFQSDPLESSLARFSRVIMVYDTISGGRVTFYQGNKSLGEKTPVSIFGGTHYEMNGRLELGRNFEGHMMEVRLWKKALTANEMSQTQLVRLSGYEQSLLAYYPMDEGKGAVAKDLANGNHIDLEGTSWQMPEGHSMRLTAATAQQGIKPRLSNKYVNLNDASDYTIMFWWRAEDHASLVGDTMALFSTGNGRSDGQLFIGLVDGVLTVYGNGQTLASASTTQDENWHHMTLTVNRAANLVNLFADEKLVAQGAANGFPGITGDPYLGYCNNISLDTASQGLVYGDSYWFRGHIDNFSLWHSALPLDFISLYANNAPSGEEIALNAYLQFHRKQLNNNGIYEVVPSIFNEVCKRDPETGLITVNANENRDTLLCIDQTQVNAIWDHTNYAPVQEAKKMTKLNYQYKTKNDQLLIELTNMEKTINKQRAFISVRAVEDLNGNPMESTITIPVYVDLNRIRWSDYGCSVKVNEGETTEILAHILNRCGSIKQFTVSTEDHWLTSSTTSGQLQPKEERTIRLSVSNGLNPGSYTSFVYVTDESGLSEPLMVNVEVVAPEPEWIVDRSDASITASLMADVMMQNGAVGYTYDLDTRDIVAAFAGNRCLGRSNLTVTPDAQSKVYMTLYGSSYSQNAQLTFYLWQASTGRIYQLHDAEDIAKTYSFQPNACYGCATPLVLRTIDSDNIQMITLNPGWNWISTYLLIDTVTNNINQTILTRSIFSDGDQIKTTADGGSFTNFFSDHWAIQNSSLEYIWHENVYQLRCNKGGKMEIVGSQLGNDERSVLVGNNEWCHLPFLSESTLSVTDALTSYYNFAQTGDIVKGYEQFAVFTDDKHWVGSLEYMRPGSGYFILSHSKTLVPIDFVNLDNTDRLAPKRSAAQPSGAQRTYTSSSAMPIIAQVKGISLKDGDQLRAFVGDECVGSAEAKDGLFFLMAHASDGRTVEFRLFRDGVEIARSLTTMKYSAAAVKGAVEAPEQILFAEEATGAYKVVVDDHVYIVVDGLWYHIDGRRVRPLR